MTQEELNALANEFYDYLANQKDFYEVWPSDDDTICVSVDWGDWRHDHLRLDSVARKFFNEKGYDVLDMDTEVTDENGSDTYSATHSYRLRKHVEESKEYKMIDSSEIKVEEDVDTHHGDVENVPFVVVADNEKFGFDTKDDAEDFMRRNQNSFEKLDLVVKESLEEEVESKIKLNNPRLVSWKEMYINDVCDGDEQEFYDSYYYERADEDEDYWDEPCQAFFDVSDDKGNYLGTIGVYKFESNGYWYEIGFRPNEKYIDKEKLDLEDLDIEEDGWFDDDEYDNKPNGSNLLSEEDYRTLLKPYLSKIENALEYHEDELED